MRTLSYKVTMRLFRLERHQLLAYAPAEGVDIVPITKDNLSELKAFGETKRRESVAWFRKGDVGM